MSVLSAPYFHDEEAAYTELEATLWPHGPVCPRCSGKERITPVKGGRIGLYRCGPCKRQFTVTVGTVFESSHVKLNLWLQAVYLMCSSKKGISSHQLMRTLDVQYKTAWFMTHRIREAMTAPIITHGLIIVDMPSLIPCLKNFQWLESWLRAFARSKRHSFGFAARQILKSEPQKFLNCQKRTSSYDTCGDHTRRAF